MPNKMLIDATHSEETRVVVVRGNRVEEFDFETAQRKQLRGNIYLAKVTRVEPSLQAAFIEYGGNRHGFLAFSEIHPDYYQIPMADRQALIEADERAHREEEEESENRSNRRRSRHRNSRRRGNGERVQSDVVEGASIDPSQTPQPFDDDGVAYDRARRHSPANTPRKPPNRAPSTSNRCHPTSTRPKTGQAQDGIAPFTPAETAIDPALAIAPVAPEAVEPISFVEDAPFPIDETADRRKRRIRR